MRRVFLSLLLLVSLAACVHGQGTSFQAVPVQTIAVDGVDIGYRVLGKGEPLLMIMGYAGTMDVWAPKLVERLAQSHTVILFDNRNMGYSSISPETVTISRMAQDALGVLRGLNMERAHVLGWSMGSIIAQEMAYSQPEALGKLILYGTAFECEPVMAAIKGFEGLSQKEFMARLFPKAWVAEHSEIYSHLPVPAIAPTAYAIGAQQQALAQWPGAGTRPGSLDREVLLLVGEDDDITPVGQSLLLAREIKGASLVRFKGAGHWLMYQAPEEMAATVQQFLVVKHDLLH